MTLTPQEKLNTLRWRENNYEDIIFYSYKVSPHDHINDHEMKRFEHSISSLREFNNEIPVYLFCDDPSLIPSHFVTDYSVKVKPFEKGFDHNHLFIHRWCNLKYFEKRSHNILYVDSDVIFYDDVQYIFDTYCTCQVYGREEMGFRHDPNTGGGRNIREQLDMVDVGIFDLGGTAPMYKFCMGVLLLNDNIHQGIVASLNDMIDLMDKVTTNQIFSPIPNRRILDEYVMWVILSRIGAIAGMFAVQDVTQGWIEEKHQEYFNPVICHYTTKQEQQFARSDEKYKNLIRDADGLMQEIDPYSTLPEQTIDHLSYDMIESMAEDHGVIASDVWSDLNPSLDEGGNLSIVDLEDGT